MTHAFFKALLFLGSGSVIYAMHAAYHATHSHEDAQDMRNMGGMKKYMPVTWVLMWAATLAIAGVPPFAGFFSKDEILGSALSTPYFPAGVRYVIWGLGTVAALCTAYYMFRLVFLTFFGSFRGTHEQEHHLHESPATMTIPLIVLATLSTIGGLALAWNHNLAHWLEPIYPNLGGKGAEFAIENEYMLMGVAVVVAAIGTWLAYIRFYKRGLEADAQFASNAPGLARAIENKWYVDEFYGAVIVRPLERLSVFFWKFVDAIIDGIAAMLGYIVQGFGDLLRFFQTGNVRNYALMLFLGVIVFIWVIA